MNNNPETDLDLEKLFLPAWAQVSPAVNRYAKFEGGGDDSRRDDRRRPGDRRPPRRDFGGPPPRKDGNRPPRGDGQRRPDRGGGRPQHGQRNRDERPERRPEPLPLPEVNISFDPDNNGVESMARQIKMTGRAYPLFQIAQLILQKPERHAVQFSIKKQADGQAVQPLFLCALDDTLWLSEDEVVTWILDKHFATFYQADRTATEPPKGVYTFVAQCGMSGIILGPPNHHDYQNQLRKLHAERFARMPFDAFKARVRIVRDEAVVKKWVEDQSWKTEFVCLNMPEPLRLQTREAVEKHFRETHLGNIVKRVDTHTLPGPAARSMRCTPLARLARQAWEDQTHFPLQIATTLSQRFASRGLQFFKVNKTVTHVAVARPNYLDLDTTPVSDGIRRIVQFINATPKCTRRKLFEALAPLPAPAPIPVAPTDAATTPAESAPKAAEPAEPTPEQTVLISDLHWLIHQGHILEFANGIIETAKKPLPRPPKPEKKPSVEAAAKPVVEEETSLAEEARSESSAAPEESEVPPVEADAAVASREPVLPESEPATPAGAEVSAVEVPPETEPVASDEPASASASPG